MNDIINEVFDVCLKSCNKEATATQLLTKGAEVLHTKNIKSNYKREILRLVIERIAYGDDGVGGTDDDRLSPKTVLILKQILEHELIDDILMGIIAQIKKREWFCFKWF